MKQVFQMIAESAAKGIADGIREFLKRSLTITVLVLLLAGSSYINWQMLQINSLQRHEYREEIRQYAEALNKANRLMIEIEMEMAKCTAERQRMAAEIIYLKWQVNKLAKKR